MSDRNTSVVEEFRAHRGVVGGAFAGRPLLLLHHTGARSGEVRVTPLMYQALDGGYAVFASKGGADTNPDWFYNLKAHPDATIEVGPDLVAVRAREAAGAERDAIWTRQKAEWPFFAEYERRTARASIPVIVLDPV